MLRPIQLHGPDYRAIIAVSAQISCIFSLVLLIGAWQGNNGWHKPREKASNTAEQKCGA